MKIRRALKQSALALAAGVILITAAYFPYNVDTPLTPEKLEEVRRYYADAYKKGTPTETQSSSEYDTKYLRIGIQAAEAVGVKEQVSAFAATYGLQKEAVLDI